MGPKRIKRKVEERKYVVEKILNKRITDEGKLEHFLKWKGSPDCDNAEKKKKRNLSDAEGISSRSGRKKKAYVKDSDEGLFSSIATEILLKIFQHLTFSELGRVARVCRRWNECAKCRALWKNKVDVQFNKHNGSQNELAVNIIEKLTFSVTHLKLDFKEHCNCEQKLNFEEFCVRLENSCPALQTLVLLHAKLSFNFQSCIDLCSHYLPSLQVLAFHWCGFSDCSVAIEYGDISNIKVLDVSECSNVECYCKLPLPAVLENSLPYLTKLYLGLTSAGDTWFFYLEPKRLCAKPFLACLEVLNLAGSFISYLTLKLLQTNAINLTELYLCCNPMVEDDYFRDLMFPQLKTICLRGCSKVTAQGVVSLIQLCQSLQNVNVDREIVAYLARKSLITDRGVKIVNTPECPHFEGLNHLYVS